VVHKPQQRSTNARDDAVPCARVILPEQAGGRVPRAVVAIDEPAPVGDMGSNTQTGFPSAPARWATLVSTEITRSRFAISAAVSEKSFSSLPKCRRPRALSASPRHRADFLLKAHKSGVDIKER